MARVKYRGRLDYVLNQFAKTKVKKMDGWTRNILRMAAYQILQLDKVPHAAAVNEAVKLAKRYGHVDKFVNAVLRNLLRGLDALSWPNREQDPVQYLAVQYSFPQWMAERFVGQYGLAQAEQLCAWYNQPAPLWIRTNTLKISRSDLKAQLEQAGTGCQRKPLYAGGLKAGNGSQFASAGCFSAGPVYCAG